MLIIRLFLPPLVLCSLLLSMAVHNFIRALVRAVSVCLSAASSASFRAFSAKDSIGDGFHTRGASSRRGMKECEGGRGGDRRK